MPVQLTLKTSIDAQLVRQGLEDLTAEIPKIGRKRIYEAVLRVRGVLRTPGARPTYPINWVSAKQKRAFFATDGFGGGIPHARRGMEKRWDIVPVERGYRFENPAPGAVYVFGNYEGERQSPIHAGRWAVFQEVVEKEIQELPEDIEQHITYYARGRGF